MEDPSLPPLEYLFECSQQSLGDLELAYLDRAAQSLKAAKAEWNNAVGQAANAEVVRYFRDHRPEILDMARRTIERQSTIEFPGVRKRA
jgi:hypothetical protein